MPDVHTYTAPGFWFVLRTHPRQEFRAEHNLRSGGIEVFLPRVSARHARRVARLGDTAPLFPQYLFARFDLEARLHDVTFTRGVQAAVRVGADLAIIDDGPIAFLKSRVGADGLIPIGEPLRPGEKVIIEEGPFAALVGVVERCCSERDRVTVLLTTVRAPLRLELGLRSVRRLPQSAA